MVGRGVLRECVLAPDVDEILVIGRSSIGRRHRKIREVLVADPADQSELRDQLAGFDACFFCLGVSSAGMAEPGYRKVTYDLTLSVAGPLAAANPTMVFVYVSGEGTDSTEQGRVMWARVKGATENALLRLPFRAYMFRPGVIQARHGIRSKTLLYQIVMTVIGPVVPVLRRIAPKYFTTTDEVGRAMLAVARHPGDQHILNTPAINRLAAG